MSNKKKENKISSAIQKSNPKNILITNKEAFKSTHDSSGTKKAESDMQSEGGGS